MNFRTSANAIVISLVTSFGRVILVTLIQMRRDLLAKFAENCTARLSVDVASQQ